MTTGSFRCIYSHFRRLKFEIFWGCMPPDLSSLLTLTLSHLNTPPTPPPPPPPLENPLHEPCLLCWGLHAG